MVLKESNFENPILLILNTFQDGGFHELCISTIDLGNIDELLMRIVYLKEILKTCCHRKGRKMVISSPRFMCIFFLLIYKFSVLLLKSVSKSATQRTCAFLDCFLKSLFQLGIRGGLKISDASSLALIWLFLFVL